MSFNLVRKLCCGLLRILTKLEVPDARRVIVAVLMMMIILPFLQTEETDLGPLFGLSLLFLNRSPCATVQD